MTADNNSDKSNLVSNKADNSRIELQNIEGHFKILTESSAAGIYVLYGEYFQYVNSRMAEIHGYTPDEMLQKKYYEFIHPEFVERVKERGRDRQKGIDVPSRYKLKVLTKSGEPKWIELVANSTHIEGKFVILGTVLDITERQKTEEVVNRNSKLQKLIAEISTDFINVTSDNIDSKISKMLKQSGEFFGADRSYLHQFSANGDILNNTHEWCIKNIFSVKNNLQNIPIEEYPWVRKQIQKQDLISIPLVDNLPDDAILEKREFQRQRIKSLFYFPIYSNDRPIGLFGFDYVRSAYEWEADQIQFFKVVTNIISNALEKIRAEYKIKYHQNLQDLLIRLSTRFINLPTDEVDSAVELSLEELGAFVEADRAYIFDYDHDNKIAHYKYEWCADGISPAIHDHPVLSFENESDLVNNHLMGHYFLITDVDALPDQNPLKQPLSQQDIKSMVTFPMISDNDYLGFVGFDSVKKIHFYSEKEIQLLEVFAQMLVNIRVRYSLQKNLIAAKQEAEKTSRYKSEFLANMSHEIRTPLHGIVGFIDLLIQTSISAEQQQYLQNARASSESLIEIINDILDFSKIEAGKMEIQELESDFQALIDETISIVRPAANQKGLKLEIKLEEGIPRYIFIDPLRLKQVLLNLLSNAIKFTSEGKVELSVSFTYNSHQDTTGSFHFSVTDTGIGIPDSQKDRLFKSFSQGDTSTTRRFGGTGLGLIISSTLVEQMGGKIEFSSNVDAGSRFYFTLTKQYKQGISTLTVQNEAGSQNTDATPDLKLRILVVEDVEMNLLLIKTVLKKQLPQAEIIEAVNGLQAVNMFVEFQPDIILMDLRMPELNGYEATKKIRELEKNTKQKVKIIALTAEAVKGEMEKCIEAGMDDFLSKPLNTSVFIEMIRKYSKSQSEGSGDKPHNNMHYDRAALMQRVGDDKEFLSQILGLGITEISILIQKLYKIIQDQNWDEVRVETHKLKGLTRNLSFVILGNLMENLEKLSHSVSPDLSTALRQLGDIETEFKLVKIMVDSELDN